MPNIHTKKTEALKLIRKQIEKHETEKRALESESEELFDYLCRPSSPFWFHSPIFAFKTRKIRARCNSIIYYARMLEKFGYSPIDMPALWFKTHLQWDSVNRRLVYFKKLHKTVSKLKENTTLSIPHYWFEN